MNAPLTSNSSLTTTRAVVDVLAEGQPAELSVRWPAAGPSARPVEPETVEQLRRQLEALHQAEQDRGLQTGVPVARKAVGQALWDIVDGPERRLTRAMEATDAQGDPLDLVVRLRIEADADAGPLDGHPATAWRWELLSPPSGEHPTADGRVRLVVQLGDVDPGPTPRFGIPRG